MPLQANQAVSVVMPANAWELTLRCLAEQPYKIVAPLIQTIERQCNAQQVEDMAQQQNVGQEAAAGLGQQGPRLVADSKEASD